MSEKIYTIPVNDAFDKGSECPICSLYQELEQNAVEFITDTAYMQDDIRMETDEKGFCEKHISMMLLQKNRLGIALMLKTHLDRQIRNGKKASEKPVKIHSLLKKEPNPAADWAENAQSQCFVCDRINLTFPVYLDSVLYLYKRDPEFRKKYEGCKGFCQKHYAMLLRKGQEVLSQKEFDSFYQLTANLYFNNLQRLSDDLDWFCDKFDYRYHDAPWKDSKDAIERGIVKTNSILPDDKKK